MSGNSSSNGGLIGNLDMIVTIIILAALCVLFKHVWHGIVWAFNAYIEYLRIN
ncbi:MAG: hypothetical protein MJ108_10520 [Saccharofermentans sp.]|nr:hypothetical protein [Saccharofermentans sp.]